MQRKTSAPTEWKRGYRPGTFSIAAYDSEEESFGVAVATGIVAVGATCPYVSDTAAVVTQSFTKTSHGSDVLSRVADGEGIESACESVLAEDKYSNYRQLHGVNRNGGQFAFTGDDCIEWCGSTTGANYSVAGNMLSDAAVIDAVSDAFTAATGPLSEQLLSGLEAGQKAGGDKRGKVSSALLVHAPEPKLYHNLRIDAAEQPIRELRELYETARETERNLQDETARQLGSYPDEILEFGVKY
ncbi:DUF1028 domain-containing protein [Haladaptatus caseinilyticus]|uniref:DUF1028 domain-containing protein n=1 Tax=Haladaptatus caseinilyticus TaxID=2993314 RepID=UPI00224B8480|nr:DUF1028 domain-containing protein [Haladaptatus caseinilyticus]